MLITITNIIINYQDIQLTNYDIQVYNQPKITINYIIQAKLQ